MSETYEKIQEAIKVAMKSGDTTTRDVLRMVVSDIKKETSPWHFLKATSAELLRSPNS